MKYYTIMFLLLVSIRGISQGVFIQSNVGFRHTSIFNKENTKSIDYSNAKMAITFRPNFGLQFGYDFGVEKIGLSRVSLGLAYLPIQQNYNGQFTVTTYNFDIEAYRRLDYLQIPLLLEFNINPSKRVQPTVQFGASYNMLLSYSSLYESTPLGAYQKIENEKEHYYVYSSSGERSREHNAISSEWRYKKSAIMAHLGGGLNFNLSEKIDVSAVITSSFSFEDVENKKELTFNYDYGNGQPTIERTLNPYEQYIDFTRTRSSQTSEQRGNSTIRTLGLQLAMSYKLFTKESIFKNQ